MASGSFVLILAVLHIVCLVFGADNQTVSTTEASGNDTVTTTTTPAATTTPGTNKEEVPTRRTMDPSKTSTHPPLVHATEKSATMPPGNNKTQTGKSQASLQFANVLLVTISIFTIVPTVMY